MITIDMASRLKASGIEWTPVSGDRFMIPHRDMDDDLFVVSEMTIEVHEILGDRIIKFNGTTEWALDSISADQVLWLPRGAAHTRLMRGGDVVPEGATLTASGRQAFALVARDLRDRGISSILVGDHYCTTMTWPFQLEGIRVVTVATGHDVLLDPDALRAALAAHRAAAILHCETFGNRASSALAGALGEARASGIPVVVDITHSLLDAPHAASDYQVASLRKLLPLPEGGFATGVGSPELRRSALDEEIVRLSSSDSQDGPSRADDLMDTSWTPSALGVRTRETLRSLDPQFFCIKRRRNAARLREMIGAFGLPVVNPEGGACPVVVSHPHPDAARAALIEIGHGSPIHWRRPSGLRPGTPWRTDLVAMPNDPDLGEDALVGVAHAVATA